MSIYRKEIQILSSDVDMTRHLRLSTLFTWMQEAAIAHTIQLGVPRRMTLDRGLLWVVTQYRAEISRLPSYDETVSLTSWPGEMLHIFFPRHYALLDQDGQPLVRAVSLWALMEQTTRRIAFPEEYGIAIKGTKTGSELPLPGRIRTMQTDLEIPCTVPYSYVDLNGHMNNARYFDLISDYYQDCPGGLVPKEISAEYIGELRYKDSFVLRSTVSEKKLYVCGEKDKPVFRIQITRDS